MASISGEAITCSPLSLLLHDQGTLEHPFVEIDVVASGDGVIEGLLRFDHDARGLSLPHFRRQAAFSSDILYDTLRKYDPDHLMLRITRDEASRGLVDFGRIEEMLARSAGRIDVVRAPHVTPLAAPLLLEVGKVPIKGEAEARLMREAADALLAEAGLEA